MDVSSYLCLTSFTALYVSILFLTNPQEKPEAVSRKEVFQPHLPVRLPCYDLVPIASLTLDGSPQKGQAAGFGRYPLS